ESAARVGIDDRSPGERRRGAPFGQCRRRRTFARTGRTSRKGPRRSASKISQQGGLQGRTRRASAATRTAAEKRQAANAAGRGRAAGAPRRIEGVSRRREPQARGAPREVFELQR